MPEVVTDAPLSRNDRITAPRSLEGTETIVDSHKLLSDAARALILARPPIPELELPVSYQILALWTAATAAVALEKRKVAAALANEIADVAERLRRMLQDLWPHAPSPALWEREVEAYAVVLSQIAALARRLLLGSNPESLDRRMRSLLEALDRTLTPFFPAGRLSSKWYLGSVVTPAVLFNFYLTSRVDLPSVSSAGLRIDALLDEQCIGAALTLTQGKNKLQLSQKKNLEIAQTTAGPGYRLETKVTAPPAPWDLEAWDEAGSVSVSIRSAEGGGVKLKSTISAPSIALIFPDGISELEVAMLPLSMVFPRTMTQSSESLRTVYATWAALALAIAGVTVAAAALELVPLSIPPIILRLAIAEAGAAS